MSARDPIAEVVGRAAHEMLRASNDYPLITIRISAGQLGRMTGALTAIAEMRMCSVESARQIRQDLANICAQLPEAYADAMRGGQ